MRAGVLLMLVVVLRSVLVLARFVVMLVGFHAVDQPDALDRRENHPIEDARRRLEHADHGIGMLAVLRAARSQAVTADEVVAHAEPGPGRDERAERRFERRLPQPAPGQLAAIVPGIGVLGADDAKARQTVAQRQRNGFRDKRVLRPAFGLGERNVPRRKIDVIDAGQDELQGLPLLPITRSMPRASRVRRSSSCALKSSSSTIMATPSASSARLSAALSARRGCKRG